MRHMRIVLAAVLLAGLAQAKLGRVYEIDGHIYRGREPGPHDYGELKRMGIRTILDLRGGPIHEPRDRKRAEAAGMQYISIRLSGLWEPHDWQIAKVLAVLEDPARWPIYVHCWRGSDRVGMVIACYRMHYDHWTNQQALAEARRDHMNFFEVLLRRYIEHFDPNRIGLPSREPGRGYMRR